MEAIATADVVFRAEFFVGLLHRIHHGRMHVGEPLVLLSRKFLVDVAEMGEGVVIGDVRRLLSHLLARTEKVGVDGAG